MTYLLTVNMPLPLRYPEEEMSPEPSPELQQLQGKRTHSNTRVQRSQRMWDFSTKDVNIIV